MAARFADRQRWSAAMLFAVGDTVKTIQVAPGAGKALYVVSLHIFQTVGAAQALGVQDTSGTVVLWSGPASGAVGVKMDMDINRDSPGIKLTDNEALIITAPGTGNRATVIASGYIDGVY